MLFAAFSITHNVLCQQARLVQAQARRLRGSLKNVSWNPTTLELIFPNSQVPFLNLILMAFRTCAATLAVDEQLQNAGAEAFRKFER